MPTDVSVGICIDKRNKKDTITSAAGGLTGGTMRDQVNAQDERWPPMIR